MKRLALLPGFHRTTARGGPPLACPLALLCSLLCSLLCALALAWGTVGARGADWPQIHGPLRNGTAPGERLALPWPAAGPRVAWKAPVGSGYAGPAVAAGRVLLFHRQGDDERLDCFDAATGEKLWNAVFPARYRGGVDADLGPRCVPLVQGERVVVFGAAGHLHCVQLNSGKKLWSRDAYGDYEGKEGYFGAGATPLALTDRVLVNVGGGPNAGLVAFSLADGTTLWSATNEGASYSSPALVTLGNRPYALFVTRLNLVAVDPRDGSTPIRLPFGKSGPTVNAATPLVFGGETFVTASYGIGCRRIDLAASPPRTLWGDDDTLSSQYNTPVFHGQHLYGIHGREDAGLAELRCVEGATGRVAWSEENFGTAHAIVADDKLLLLKSRGELVVAEANPRAYRQVAAARVGTRVTRALPALSGGRFFLRDNGDDGGTLYCLEVGPTLPAAGTR